MSREWSDDRLSRTVSLIQEVLEGKCVVDLPEPDINQPELQVVAWSSPKGPVVITRTAKGLMLSTPQGKMTPEDAREYAAALLAAATEIEKET
jgi:hypothetical protein